MIRDERSGVRDTVGRVGCGRVRYEVCVMGGERGCGMVMSGGGGSAEASPD